MTPTAWQAFLNANPANMTPAAATSNTVYDLSGHNMLAITGSDADTFLQGQLTCDLRQLSDTHSLRGAACTPQGRVYATFRLATYHDHRVFLLPPGMAEPLQQALHKYILFSQASFSTTPNELVMLGLSGPDLAKTLSPWWPQLPQKQHDTVLHGDSLLITIDPDAQRCIALVPIEHAQQLWQNEAFTPAGPDAWQQQDIALGLGDVTPTTQHDWLPQSLNMDLTHAVSFDKGCYTGQEVIARLHYRGQAKYRMYRITGKTPELPPAGTRCLHQHDGQCKPVGNIVVAVRHDPERIDALAVLRCDSVDTGTLHLETTPDSQQKAIDVLQQLPLPYAITK